MARFSLIYMILLLVTVSATADPLPYFEPIGAREAGMGGATNALTFGPTSIYHNPASMVYQVLSGCAGMQPVAFDRYPRSWWVQAYNRKTEFGFPLALFAQGWLMPTKSGMRRNAMLAFPFAYSFSPYSPAAVDIKPTMERTESGKWIGGLPIDVGFMGAGPSGANIGIVLRNVSPFANRLETMERHIDYGAAYELGAFTWSVGTASDFWPEKVWFRDRFRMGIEISNQKDMAIRAGYTVWDEDKWYTAGIGVASPKAGIFVDYAIVYHTDKKTFEHYLQYSYIIR